MLSDLVVDILLMTATVHISQQLPFNLLVLPLSSVVQVRIRVIHTEHSFTPN